MMKTEVMITTVLYRAFVRVCVQIEVALDRKHTENVCQ